MATTAKRTRRKRILMDVPEGTISLGAPSKMPGYAWGLPAGITCPSAKKSVKDFGADAVCSGCYVVNLETGKGRGNYRFPAVWAAMVRRMDFVKRSLKENDGDEAVAVLTDMVRRGCDAEGENVFRVHDAGDLFHPLYADVWGRVADNLPEVSFWIPTREWARDLMLPSLRELAARPNVTVRPSGLTWEAPAPVVEGLSAGTAVTFDVDGLAEHRTCPATLPGSDGKCGECRNCWDPGIRVAYLAHGQGAAKSAKRVGKSLPIHNS